MFCCTAEIPFSHKTSCCQSRNIKRNKRCVEKGEMKWCNGIQLEKRKVKKQTGRTSDSGSGFFLESPRLLFPRRSLPSWHTVPSVSSLRLPQPSCPRQFYPILPLSYLRSLFCTDHLHCLYPFHLTLSMFSAKSDLTKQQKETWPLSFLLAQA